MIEHASSSNHLDTLCTMQALAARVVYRYVHDSDRKDA